MIDGAGFALRPIRIRAFDDTRVKEVCMTRRLISTGSPFEKTAGYSRAVVDGDFVFVSGTTGYDYATMTMPADVTAQTQNCFKTIDAALKEAGFAVADIVRATYYITDARDADAVFAVCGAHLGEIRPAATLLVVAGLYKPEMKIEIEVTAKRRSN
jgi:enamine deaminase RidA (YjgF/YER057c/UK114 family)